IFLIPDMGAQFDNSCCHKSLWENLGLLAEDNALESISIVIISSRDLDDESLNFFSVTG
ncbi:hypothetical protein ACJX0J_018569, partial [Zea mays]